jgi:hypothetical protein
MEFAIVGREWLRNEIFPRPSRCVGADAPGVRSQRLLFDRKNGTRPQFFT